MSVAFSTSPALKHPGKFDDRTYTISNSKKKQSASNSPRRKLQSQQSTQSTQNSQHNQQTSGNPSVSVQPNQTASGRGPMRRRNSNDNLNYRKGNEVKPFKYRKQEDYENSRDPPSPTLSVSSSSGYNVSNNSSMTSNHSSRVHHSPESRTIGKYSAHDLHSLRYQMRNNEATRKMQLTARLIPNKSYTKQEIESLRMALSGIDNENAKNYYNVPPYSSYNSYQNQNYGYNQNRYSQNGMQQQRQYPRPGYYFHGQNPQQYHRVSRFRLFLRLLLNPSNFRMMSECRSATAPWATLLFTCTICTIGCTATIAGCP